MKIAYKGLDLPEGKVKYDDAIFFDLVQKFQPEKVSPYYFELLPEQYEAGHAIAMAEKDILDVLVLDMEKMEARLSRTQEGKEREVLERGMAHLEEEWPLCDLALDKEEQAMIKALGPLSLKPTLVCNDPLVDPHTLFRAVMDKAGMMFFYTVGKEEVHAWLVNQAADAVTCARRIHSDLARGFIKAEVVSCEHMMGVHNMQDARAKGYTNLVDRDGVIPVNSILDIRFNV